MIKRNTGNCAAVTSMAILMTLLIGVPAHSMAQGRLSFGLNESAALQAALAAQAASSPPSLTPPTAASNEPEPSIPDYPAVESNNYGQWLFGGHFARQSFSGFNPDYIIGAGDRIDLRFWGGFDFQALLDVDSQGQVFIPRIGPIRLSGVRNSELNRVIRAELRKVFREDVGVYASIAGAEPVKVFVGGGVVRPGLYGATASDSLLHFLDRAGGIEPDAGSYRRVEVLRSGKVLRRIDLYEFLTEGQLPLVQLRDGDTIFIRPRGPVASVEGLVAWPRQFEFTEDRTLAYLLDLAQVREEATHARITRQAAATRETLVFGLDADLKGVMVAPGDVVDVYADRPFSTVLVRVDGEHQGSSQLVLPYGADLASALAQITPTPSSDVENVRLYRQSLIARQKAVIDQMLQKLEESVLTARSDTVQEAALRNQEAQLILQFVERARKIEPRGQVVLSSSQSRGDIILEEGDRIEVPRQTQLVGVHGEVYLPAAFSWEESVGIKHYIDLAGGFTQSGARDRVLVMRPNGVVKFTRAGGWFGGLDVQPGDEILVLPRVDEKSFQLSKDIIEVVYQIAIAAGVLVRL